jgi:hypothetical protein
MEFIINASKGFINTASDFEKLAVEYPLLGFETNSRVLYH